MSFTQQDLKINGHALELRIYAEDPNNNFLPSIGKLETYIPPAGDGIRLDDGFEEGMDIPIYYDPMIAKLVTYASDRRAAIQKMLQAIKMYKIEGVATTLPFGTFVCEHEAFTSGNFDTHFVKKYFTADALTAAEESSSHSAAKVALAHYLNQRKELKEISSRASNWNNQNRTHTS